MCEATDFNYFYWTTNGCWSVGRYPASLLLLLLPTHTHSGCMSSIPSLVYSH